MSQNSERSRRATVVWVLGGVSLLVLVALAVGPPAGGAVESAESAETGENVTVYRASNATFENSQSVEVAIANGAVEPADKVALGDTLVVAIESERLADAMNTANGSTTARFFTALDGDAEFRVVQTNPTPQKNRKIASLGRDNVTVHRNGTTVYAVVETGDLAFEYRRVHRPAEIYGGERFAVQFGYDLPDDWSRATEPSSPIIEFQPRSELTTGQSPTASTPGTTSATPTPPRTSSEAPTSARSATTEQVNTTDIAGQSEAPGVPGFTVPTVLVALLVVAALGTRRS